MNYNEKEYAEKIRNSYEEKTATKLDELKALDRQVKRPAEAIAYTFGTLGSLILGSGMCDCYSSIFPKHQTSHRFSNNVTSSNDHTLFSCDLNAGAF